MHLARYVVYFEFESFSLLSLITDFFLQFLQQSQLTGAIWAPGCRNPVAY
jgi:hypothetical protein